jgi:topoisomerase IV subunit A
MSEQAELPLVPPSGESGETLTLGQYAERAYLDYAISVVKGRALPEVADGLKPVQRRILFSMSEMGLAANAKPVKSARVVGDVLGKFHPHGDSAAYDALVRLAQSFTMRYPLIDGQGNFGSRDGDGAAAMRYTEARLTNFSKLLLDEIDEGTVDFVPNYDGAFQEPKLMPARLPMVLLNGASGIAVGMATEIPPHNLREVAAAAVAVIRNPQLSNSQLMEILPGPDFPGGGQIISGAADLAEIYANGRGSIKTRARYSIEEMARGQWQLVINELPHGVSTQKVLEEIEEISNPKIKLGKKALSPDQLSSKQTLLSVLDAVRDESGKEAAVRLVFEPRTSKIEQQDLISTLLALTSLESTTSMNLVAIGLDGRPRQKPVLEVLREWSEFRTQVVERRTGFRLDKVARRIHILQGRQIALLNIDEVIRIIRESDEPKPALMQAFGLSEIQTEDILEIRLRQLARLEAIKLETELAALTSEQAGLQALLDNPAALKRQLIKEVEADAKTYGDDRRTLILAAQRASVQERVVDEPVTIVVSDKGWVRARQGHGHDPSMFTFKQGDTLAGCYEVRTADTVYVFSTSGRVFNVPVQNLPSARGDGQPITTFVELEAGQRIEHVFAANDDMGVLLASKRGYGFLCQAKDLSTRIKNGKQFMTLDGDADAPLKPALFTPGLDHVVCASEEGRALVFPLGELKVLKSGGRGIILMGLDPKESLSAVLVTDKRGMQAQGLGRGAKQRVEVWSLRALKDWMGARARKGKLLEPRVKAPVLSIPLKVIDGVGDV